MLFGSINICTFLVQQLCDKCVLQLAIEDIQISAGVGIALLKTI